MSLDFLILNVYYVAGDQLTVPPVPVLLLMSTCGILSPFHAVNLAQNAPKLTREPEELRVDGARKGMGAQIPDIVLFHLII